MGPEVRWLIIKKQRYREIAAYVQRSEHTVGNIVRKWKREEGLEPSFKGAAGSCSLSTDELRLIEGLLNSRPDTFVTTELVQLVREVTGRGDDLRPAAVYAAVKKAGITRKRAAHAASQQDEPLREAYRELRDAAPTHTNWYFLDESGFGRHTTRRSYAWAPCGERAFVRQPLLQGQNITMLSCIGVNGMVFQQYAKGGYNAERFLFCC